MILIARRTRLIEYISSKEGVEWVKMEDICDDFKKKNQPVKGALLPAEQGAIAKDPSLPPSPYLTKQMIADALSNGRPSAPDSLIAHQAKQGVFLCTDVGTRVRHNSRYRMPDLSI